MPRKTRLHAPERHVFLAVALKFALLGLLWWFLVRDYRSEPGPAGVAHALLPLPPAAAETRKDHAP